MKQLMPHEKDWRGVLVHNNTLPIKSVAYVIITEKSR